MRGYYSVVPLSGPAMVAAGISGALNPVIEELKRRKEQERLMALAEQERKQKALEKYQDWKIKDILQRRNIELQKGLEEWKRGLTPTEQEKAEIDYKKALAGKIKNEASEEVKSLQDKLRKAYERVEFLNREKRLQQLKYDIDKKNLKEKFGRTGAGAGGGAGVNELADMLKYFENLELRLEQMKATAIEREDDEWLKEINGELEKVRQRIGLLRKMHPYEQAIGGLIPESASKVEKPGFMTRGINYFKDIGSEIAGGKAFGDIEVPGKMQGVGSLDVITGAAPEDAMRGAIVNKAVKEPPIPSNWYMIRKLKKKDLLFKNKKALDYLSWWVLTHPEDSGMGRLYLKLVDDPDFAWYFK